jgi:hypothetical protein
MFRKMLFVCSAVILAAPALATPQQSPRGGSPAGAALVARVNSQGPANASPRAIDRANENSVLRTNPVTTVAPQVTTNPATGMSQGPQHASPTGVAHANAHSVLAGGAVAADTLPGLTTGLTVQTSAGTTLGTVSQVVTGTDGSIRLVIVTSPTGETYRLAPSTLSISGGVVTTTSISVGG